MKRHFIFITIIIICIFCMLNIESSLMVLKNKFLIKADLTNYDEFMIFKDYPLVNEDVLGSTMYKSNNGSLKSKYTNPKDVRYYEVDGNIDEFLNLKLLKGRFIWSEDYENRVNYIVIDEKLAVYFFLNTDCIGEKVELDGKEYLICGVYEDDESILGKLSKTYRDDSSLVFIPIEKPSEPKDNSLSSEKTEVQRTFGEYIILFKIKAGYGFMMNKGMQNYFSQNIGKEVYLKNLDYEARKNIQKMDILKFAVFFIVALNMIIWLANDFKYAIEKINNDFKKYYLKKLIDNNMVFFIKKFILYSFCIILILYFYNKVKFEFIINPDLIPSRFINIDELKSKILNYIVSINTMPNYGTKFEALIKNGGAILNYLGILVFAGFLYYFNIVINKIKIGDLFNKILDFFEKKFSIVKTPKLRRGKHGSE